MFKGERNSHLFLFCVLNNPCYTVATRFLKHNQSFDVTSDYEYFSARKYAQLAIEAFNSNWPSWPGDASE